jgi:hypothetical protein
VKKLILITFFSFFVSSVSYSKIITLKDCYTDTNGNKSFNENVYDDYKFVIDTNKKVVTNIYVWADKEIKRQLQVIEDVIKRNRDEGKKTQHLESLRVMDKVMTAKFIINFIDNDYVTGELDEKDKNFSNVFRQSINVFLQKKTVSYTMENKQDKTKRTINFYCK